MNKSIRLFGILFIIVLIIVPSAAQIGPRITGADSAATAHSFSPDAQIIVTGVETATIEGTEPDHSCLTPSSPGGHSVWFRTTLQPGTLSVDTTGTSYSTAGATSADSIISVYRFEDSNPGGFNSYTELISVGCNDNPGTAGTIQGLVIEQVTTFYIQVSAAPSVTAIAPSTVILTADFTAAVPHPYDNPGKAKVLKLPNLPTVTNVANATLSLNEPIDPALPFPITNTIWTKFTLTTKRVVWFQNFYYQAATLWFSIFTKSGPTFTPANGIHLAGPDIIFGALEPGTYFMRIGIVNAPPGTTQNFITFTGLAYLSPIADEFSVAMTEGTPGATASMEGWVVRKPSGDGEACEDVAPYDCYFKFVSVGAAEATKLKANVHLNNVKLKKGDMLLLQAGIGETSGEPNLKVKVVLRNAAGASLTYRMNIRENVHATPKRLITLPAGFVPVRATTTVANLDTDAGDSIELDGLVIVGIRSGEALRSQPLKLDRLGKISSEWATPVELKDELLTVPPIPVP